MGMKGQQLIFEQFMDLISFMKNLETIIDAFSIFYTDRKGNIDEDELRSIQRKYTATHKGKEIKKILEKSNVTFNGKNNYKTFV